MPNGDRMTTSLPTMNGSCWRLEGNAGSWPVKFPSQTDGMNPCASGVPVTSHKPMWPVELKNQTYLPSAMGVHDVASLYWYAMMLGSPLPVRGLVRHLMAPVFRSMA